MPLPRGRATFCFNDFQQNYADLLMSVTSFDWDKTGQFENKGICRNPISTLDNTHKGISMLILGFSAAVAERFFNTKHLIKINPLINMSFLLQNTLPKEAYFSDSSIIPVGKSSYMVATFRIQIPAFTEIYFRLSAKNEENSEDLSLSLGR